MNRSYQGTHRRTPPLYRRLLVRTSATLAVAASLVVPPLATGTAHAATIIGCGTATAPASSLACAEELFSVAVLTVKSAAQSGGDVSVPPIVDHSSIFNTVNQALQQADDCVTLTDPTCAAIVQTLEVREEGSLFDFVNQIDAAAVRVAQNCLNSTDPTCGLVFRTAQLEAQAIVTMAETCLAGTNQTCTQLEQTVITTVSAIIALANQCATGQEPTCATVVQTAEQEAQAIETLVTDCVNGTNASVCAQLEALATAEVNALVTLANQCAAGQDPTCNSLFGTVSQVLGEAVTCAVGPIGPAAPATLPNPLVLPGASAGDGSGLPDLAVTCQQVKAVATELVGGCVSAGAQCGLGIAEVVKSPCLNTSDEVACAQATAAPPEALPPDVDPDTLFPANQLTGIVDTGAGVGVGGLEVDFYVDPAGADTFSSTPDLLGSTTTDSSGRYIFTLPSTLDAFATSQANANGGHLLVMIATSAYLTIPGTESVSLAIAQGVTSIRVGGSADYFDSLPPTLTLYPAQSIDLGDVPPPPDVDVTDPSVPAETHYQGTLGSGGTVMTVNGAVSDFNPFLVNGVDFTHATAAPPTTPADQSPPPDGGPPDNSTCTQSDGRAQFVNQWRTQHNKLAYVIVGEVHAYWDQTTGFTYSKTSDTTIQVGFSVNAASWSVEGSANIHNTHTTDWHHLGEGPYYAHQMRIQFEFDQFEDEWTCQFNRNKDYYTYQEVPTYNTWEGEPGAKVSQYDGGQRYAYSNPKYQMRIDPGSGYDFTTGKGYGYGGAFSIAGFSGGAQTEHTNTVTISQDARNSRAAEHDIWGNNAKPSNGAQIIYSY